MTGRRILQISLLRITAFEISCRIWCTKADGFRSQIYWPSKRLSQMERGLPRDSSKIHCTLEKTILITVKEQNDGAPVSVTAERFRVFWRIGLTNIFFYVSDTKINVDNELFSLLSILNDSKLSFPNGTDTRYSLRGIAVDFFARGPSY